MRDNVATFQSMLGDVKEMRYPPWMGAEAFACTLVAHYSVPWKVVPQWPDIIGAG